MERLTKRGLLGFAFYPRCFEKCDGMPDDCGICEEQEKQVEDLAAYEDTGLTPEEINDLKAGKSTPQWISVKDKMPLLYGSHFVTGVEVNARFWEVADLDFIDGENVWLDPYKEVMHGITHWMPLPYPPEDSDDIPEGATFE